MTQEVSDPVQLTFDFVGGLQCGFRFSKCSAEFSSGRFSRIQLWELQVQAIMLSIGSITIPDAPAALSLSMTSQKVS